MSVFFIRVWVDGDSIVAVRTGEGLITDAGAYGNATFIDAVAEGAYVDAGTLRPTLTYANNVLSSSLVTLLPAKDVTALLAQSGYGGQAVYNWSDGNQYQWNGNPWNATPLTSQAVTSIAETEAGAAVAAISTKLVTAFKRSTTPPAAPSGGSYNFDSQVLTPPATWSATVPAGTDRLYLTQALARVQAPTVIDDNIAWGEPNAFSQDGEASISAFLTNEAHTVPADADGSNPDLTGATTDMRVFLGLDEDTQNWTFARTNSTGVTSTISDNTVTITALPVDEGFVDITASKTGFSNITKRFTISKSRAGANGADAKLITLTATGQVFTFTFDGTADPTSQTITFTADLQNTTDTVATWSTSPAVTLTGSGNTRSLTVANFGSNTSVTVTVTADSGAVTDKITIYRVKDGGTGDRGPGRWYISLTETPYSALPITETQAITAWNSASGSNDIPELPRVYDQVIYYTGPEDKPTKQQAFICSTVTSDTVHTWNEQEELIDGDLLVTGTVTADRLQIGDSSLSSDASGGLLVQGGNITVLRDNFYTANTPISGSGFSSPPNTSDLSLVGGNALSIPAGFTADLQIVVSFEHGYTNLPGFTDDWGLRITGGFSGAITELYSRYNPTMALETDYATVTVVKRNLVNPSSTVSSSYNVFVFWNGGSADIELLRVLTSVFLRFK